MAQKPVKRKVLTRQKEVIGELEDLLLAFNNHCLMFDSVWENLLNFSVQNNREMENVLYYAIAEYWIKTNNIRNEMKKILSKIE